MSEMPARRPVPATPEHDANRSSRRVETGSAILGRGAVSVATRVDRLLTDADFSAAVARYNSFTAFADVFPVGSDANEVRRTAEKAASEYWREDQTKRVTLHFERSVKCYVLAVEQYTGATPQELATVARTETAALFALYARFVAFIEHYATKYGPMCGAPMDHDDIHQYQVLALLQAIENDDAERFLARFQTAARHVAYEVRHFASNLSMPGREMANVLSAVRKSRGDINVAMEDLASNPDRSRHMSRETFLSALHAADPSNRVDVDEPTALETPDPSAVAALLSVEDGFDREDLESAWSALSALERDVLTRTLGLDGSDPMSTVKAAEALGLNQVRVWRTQERALKSLRTAMTPRVDTTVE